MVFIEYLDFFNSKFSFYTNNRPHNQSVFGGIMTCIYIMLCILIFILFSYNDLKQLHPITTISEISDSERKLVNMNKEKIWIPFRMVNYENKFIDHRKILYIMPYLIEGRFNESIGMDLKYTLLNYTLCNETNMSKMPYNYKISVPLNQLFCLEKDDILFGGNWNHQFLNYIEINLYLCEDGVAFNSSDPRCSKINNYLNNLNSSLLFDFHFPTVQFQPTNLKTPIQIIYKNYYYRLSSYNYKIEKLYIRENIISDDKNMIKSKINNNSCWGMSMLFSDEYYLPTDYDAISDNSNSSRIYALNIYMDDGLVFYTRNYKKIFVIISDVLPILRILLYFMKSFTQYIKRAITKRHLIGLIFESNEINYIKSFKKKYIDFDKAFNQRKNKSIIMSNKSENELIKNKTFENNNCSLKEINNYRNIAFINNFKSKTLFGNQIDINSIKNKFNNFRKMGPYKKNKIVQKTNNPKYLFPIYYYFLDIIFDNLIYPKNFCCISKIYLIIYNFMCQIYDVSTYIILYKHFNILSNMLKEDSFKDHIYINTSSKLINRININDVKVIEKLNKDLKNTKPIIYSNYFL